MGSARQSRSARQKGSVKKPAWYSFSPAAFKRGAKVGSKWGKKIGTPIGKAIGRAGAGAMRFGDNVIHSIPKQSKSSARRNPVAARFVGGRRIRNKRLPRSKSPGWFSRMFGQSSSKKQEWTPPKSIAT